MGASGYADRSVERELRAARGRPTATFLEGCRLFKFDPNIRVPARVARLPRDSRGFPVPFIVKDRVNGAPVDFRDTDPVKRIHAIVDRLCGVCGGQLEGDLYLIAAPECVESRLFSFPGMHEECARFAMLACPYLSSADYKPEKPPISLSIGVPAVDGEHRPERLGFYVCREYTEDRSGPVVRIIAGAPVRVEWWPSEGGVTGRAGPRTRS